MLLGTFFKLLMTYLIMKGNTLNIIPDPPVKRLSLLSHHQSYPWGALLSVPVSSPSLALLQCLRIGPPNLLYLHQIVQSNKHNAHHLLHLLLSHLLLSPHRLLSPHQWLLSFKIPWGSWTRLTSPFCALWFKSCCNTGNHNTRTSLNNCTYIVILYNFEAGNLYIVFSQCPIFVFYSICTWIHMLIK